MQAIDIAAGATPTEIAPAGNRDFLIIANNSDEVIYLKFDGDTDNVLTTALGMPLDIGDRIELNNVSHKNVFNKKVEGIHGGAGNKEVRIAGV